MSAAPDARKSADYRDYLLVLQKPIVRVLITYRNMSAGLVADRQGTLEK
jgi:hypothetical protein